MRKEVHDWWSSGQSPTVQSVAAQSDVNVIAGVSFYRLSLPSTVVVTLSDGTTPSYSVTWAKGSYDFTSVSTQALTGTLTLPGGVTNPGGVTASVNVVVAYSPFNEYSTKVFSLATYLKSTLMTESGFVSVPITTVSSTADTVGFGYSMSPNALSWYAPSNATRPTYSSDGGLVFDGTKRLEIPASTTIFRGFYASGQNWTFKCYITCGVGTDATSMTIINSTNGSGSNNGIDISRNSSNGISVRLSRNVTNLTLFNSTATVTVASGKTSIIVSRNGTTLSVKVGNNATETSSLTNSFGSENMTNNLCIGQRPGGTVGFNGTIYDIDITNTAISAGNITSWLAFSPSISATEFPVILQQKYDPADTSNIWADTGRTTPATNGVAVALIDHATRNNFGDQFLYFVSQATPASRPTLVTNDPNTKASLDTQVNNKLTMNRAYDSGGKFTNFCVVKFTGTQDTFGNSHFYHSSSSTGYYAVITEDNYHDNYDPGFGNIVIHDGGGNPVSVKVNRVGNLHNQFAFRREGGTMTAKNGAKQTRIGGPTTFTGTFAINNLGDNGTYASKLSLSVNYNGLMTDTEMDAMIDSINTEFGF